MMRFGQYFKQRRKALKLTQGDFPGYSQSYISNIERGINNPTQRETIADLARILHLSPNQVDWLWMYSILDHDPRHCLLSAPLPDNKDTSLMVYDSQSSYVGEEAKELSTGATPQEVLHVLGKPDDQVRFRNHEKWIYEGKATHIIFKDGRVTDVLFK